MSHINDIVSHEDIKSFNSPKKTDTGILPSLWSLLSRRTRGSGRAGSMSPAKKKSQTMSSPMHIPSVPVMEPVKRSRTEDSFENSVQVEQTPKKKRGRPKKPKLEEPTEAGFVTASSSPMKSHHVFSSPAKSPVKPVLTQSPLKITLNKDFIPTPIPAEGEYNPPQEKHLTYFFDGFEGYIDQKKPIRSHKKSTNSMAMAPQVTREQFSLISSVLNGFLHRSSKAELHKIQLQMFPQYWFEVTQGFSLLFYGIGSKRQFLEQFVLEYLSPRLALAPETHLELSNQYEEEEDSDGEIEGVPCVVINGYNPTCSYRDVFHSISKIMLPEELSKSETKYWGNHVELQINKMIEVYRDTPSNVKLILLVHNLDGPMLRKDPFQNMLSSLARVRQIALVASTDHIYAPLLWDHVRTQNFNFVFHDITNYENYSVESSFNDIMKLGRNDSSTGAEGARYVLDSLTTNSKRMYRLLIDTQLNNMDSQGKITATKRGSHLFGIEFKQFYHMCAAEFIASNEISLRSMLGEFIEHKMAAISKDRTGAETVYVPYSYAEMQTLLRDVLDL
ncbi:LAFE_0E04588g1_1 [Lachancea fermentati]|uniref:Origin recognition complex subunit 2 n=1 Tax=Lachancea fermentati TaxID=4955 RepID=A0A1G4MD05_LACFM|nr:LAFE_0E04588g1_1 [Lachancea fermentati]